MFVFFKNKTVQSYIFLFTICASILAWGYFASANTVSNGSLLAGYSISPALIIWYCFYKFSNNSLKRSSQELAFSWILISLIVCFLIGFERNKNAEAKTSRFTKTELQRATDLDEKGSSLATSVDAGDQYQTLTRELADWIAQQQDWYEEELKKAKWGLLFDIGRIKSDKNLVESKDIIKKAHAIMHEFRARTSSERIFTLIKKKARSLQLPEGSDFLKGLRVGIQESQIEKNKILDIEEAIAWKAEEAFAVLVEDGQWTTDDVGIVFYDDNSVEKYNNCLKEIQALADQESSVANDQCKSANILLDERIKSL